MTDPLRILLIDDQPLIRSGMAMLIGSQPDLVVGGEAGDGQAAVDLVARLAATGEAPDVLLMDVRMPGTNGIEATREITADGSSRVLILSTFDHDEYVLGALRAGAAGFVVHHQQPGRPRHVSCPFPSVRPSRDL